MSKKIFMASCVAYKGYDIMHCVVSVWARDKEGAEKILETSMELWYPKMTHDVIIEPIQGVAKSLIEEIQHAIK